VKIDGVYISTNSREYINLLKLLERDEEATHDLPLSAPEAVQTITAVVREAFTELDSYPIEATGPLRGIDKAPVLMRRQAG
jgi:hypothetical protein